jgi:hypothetical protein
VAQANGLAAADEDWLGAAEEAGVDAVTVTVLAGAAGWLDDDDEAQPAAAAAHRSAAAAVAGRNGCVFTS